MTNREQIPPLLECRGGVPASFPAPVPASRYPDDKLFTLHERETPALVFVAIALKASIKLSTKPYVFGAVYIDWRGECKSPSGRDISPYAPFVPIRNDPEMVVNLELRVAEAGLRRPGAAA
jgi:hypothetical protein